MTDFENMKDDEFNSFLCEPVRLMDVMVREYAFAGGWEIDPNYRKQLAELDRYCMEPVVPTAYVYFKVDAAQNDN